MPRVLNANAWTQVAAVGLYLFNQVGVNTDRVIPAPGAGTLTTLSTFNTAYGANYTPIALGRVDNTHLVLLAYENATLFHDCFYSADAGGSWAYGTGSQDTNSNYPGGYHYLFNDYSVSNLAWCVPYDSAGGGVLSALHSGDSGANWDIEWTATDVAQCSGCSRHDGSTAYVLGDDAADFYAYKITTGGSWDSAVLGTPAGWGTGAIESICCDPTNPNDVYIAVRLSSGSYNQIWKYTWGVGVAVSLVLTEVDNTRPSSPGFIVSTISGNIGIAMNSEPVAGTFSIHWHSTTDSGASWNDVDLTSLLSLSTSDFALQCKTTPDGECVFIQTNALRWIYSTDEGANWQVTDDNMSSGFGGDTA